MSEASPGQDPRHRPIRSFVLRQGRLTDAQADALRRLWPRYGVEATSSAVDWDGLFGRRAPRAFEIGFGAGDALLARARAMPEVDFIGCEVHRPGVGRLLLRAEQAGVTNLRVLCDDAVEVLRDAITDGSLDELIVEFPDPWHKKRHHKRRLVQPAFVALAARKLRDGGRLRLATDWAEYADQMLAVCSQSPDLHNSAPDGGFVARPSTRPVTRFEARGERLGHAVFDLCFVRRPRSSAR